MSDPVLGYWCSELDGQPPRIEAIIRARHQPLARWEGVDERDVQASVTGQVDRHVPADVLDSLLNCWLLGISPVDANEIDVRELRMAVTIDAVAEADDSAPAIPLSAKAIGLIPMAVVEMARDVAMNHEMPTKRPDKVAMAMTGALFVDVLGSCPPTLVQELLDEIWKRADQSPKIWARGWHRLRVTLRALGAAA